MFNTLQIRNEIIKKENIPCLICKKKQSIEINPIIHNILKKYNNGVKLLYLLLDIKKYASVPYFNKLISKINNIYTPLVKIKIIFPGDIWNLIKTNLSYDLIDNQTNITLTMMYKQLSGLIKNKPIENNHWKNPNIRLFCKHCKKQLQNNCIVCENENTLNINYICEECWIEINNP